MAVKLETTVKRFRGDSTDRKPGIYREAIGEKVQPVPEGSTFTETDTGRRFIFHNGDWVLQSQTLDSLLAEMVDLQRDILDTLRATHHGHEEYSWEEEVPVGD